MTLFLHLGMQDSCLLGDCEFLFVIKLTLAKWVSVLFGVFFPLTLLRDN